MREIVGRAVGASLSWCAGDGDCQEGRPARSDGTKASAEVELTVGGGRPEFVGVAGACRPEGGDGRAKRKKTAVSK